MAQRILPCVSEVLRNRTQQQPSPGVSRPCCRWLNTIKVSSYRTAAVRSESKLALKLILDLCENLAKLQRCIMDLRLAFRVLQIVRDVLVVVDGRTQV